MPDIKLTDSATANPITDWRQWTRPKKPVEHWKPGRSAMECARAWFTSPVPIVPPEIRALLDSHDRTRGVDIVSGQPELVTSLPERGEGRNHDLALVGVLDDNLVTICIEAKADEPYGNDTIGDYWAKKQDGKSRAPARIEKLLKKLCGPNTSPKSPPWAGIMYQLLTAAAGTVIQAGADGADLAVFIIHEFDTTETTADRHQKNTADFASFVEALFGVAANQVQDGVLYGPHLTPGTDGSNQVELLVGKATYVW